MKKLRSPADRRLCCGFSDRKVDSPSPGGEGRGPRMLVREEAPLAQNHLPARVNLQAAMEART